MWTVGHSRGVADLAAAAAAAAGLGTAEAALLRQAALVHDLGRVAVPARVWAKPGPLARGEREQLRLPPITASGSLTWPPPCGHQALLFRGWYLFAVFGSAAAVAAAGLALLRRAGTTFYGGPLRLPHQPARRRHICGAAVFGAGFGLTGACPGGAIAMVATGGLGGLPVLGGLAGGMWLRGLTERPAQAQPGHSDRGRPAAVTD